MYCKQCGNFVDENKDKFCMNCGLAVDGEDVKQVETYKNNLGDIIQKHFQFSSYFHSF